MCVLLIVRLALLHPAIRLWVPVRSPPGTHCALLRGGFVLHQRIAFSRSRMMCPAGRCGDVYVCVCMWYVYGPLSVAHR